MHRLLRFWRSPHVRSFRLQRQRNDGPVDAAVVFSALLASANEVPAVSGSNLLATAPRRFSSTSRAMPTARFRRPPLRSISADGLSRQHHDRRCTYPSRSSGCERTGDHQHGLTATNTVTLTNGAGEFTFRGMPVDPAFVQQIINNPSAFYFNVHSPNNTGGLRAVSSRCAIDGVGQRSSAGSGGLSSSVVAAFKPPRPLHLLPLTF